MHQEPKKEKKLIQKEMHKKLLLNIKENGKPIFATAYVLGSSI